MIGLIGGMSWTSAAEYHAILNRTVQARLGGTHSARSLMLSVDFATVERLQHAGDWDALAAMMADAARALEQGGADFVMLCTNTMHKVAAAIEAAVAIPFLHIADPTGAAIRAAGHRRVGLLGTAFTMEQDFYRGRMRDRYGLDMLVPGAQDRRTVHDVIYRELVRNDVRPESREAYRAVIARLVDDGAEAIILGCTEIMLLIDQGDSAVPLFDTTRLHALAAVDQALG